MREIFTKTIQVSEAIDEFTALVGEEMADYATLSSFVADKVPGLTKIDILEIFQFLQILAPKIISSADTAGWDTSGLNLEAELNALYRRSKSSLGDASDKDALQMCIKSIDTIVRLKEKVQAHERIKQIEDLILKLLDGWPSEYRNQFLDGLQAVECK